ncbi:MAG: YraN family protein [Nitriliruptorales bacterium]
MPSPSSFGPRRLIGDIGEDLAARHLRERGWRIVARNWRTGDGTLRGELDLVAVKGEVLAFVEVKTRRGDGYGGPLAAVTPAKQAKIRALGYAYLRRLDGMAPVVRFDVIAVWLRSGQQPEIRHLPGVF